MTSKQKMGNAKSENTWEDGKKPNNPPTRRLSTKQKKKGQRCTCGQSENGIREKEKGTAQTDGTRKTIRQ